LPNLKTVFADAQKTACHLHAVQNEISAQTAVKMEGVLNVYEEVEQ
jgi:hypothetical protein